MRRTWVIVVVLGWLSSLTAWADSEPAATLVEVRKIWDRAPHNAFTDLAYFDNQWFCVFREGQDHVSPDGALRVIRSVDGNVWESAALIRSSTSDLRDPKLTVTPEGELMLTAAEAVHDRTQKTHQSLTWFSRDGQEWSERSEVGDADDWLWRTTWHAGIAYAIGYGCRPDNPRIRLYASRDGRAFSTLLPNMYDVGAPNETALVFSRQDVCYCLVRRDGPGANGLLATSEPPYTIWQWQDLGRPIGGPNMIQVPDGRLVAAVRLYDGAVRTGLCWIDPVKGTLQESLTLPSGGDTSYAGLVWRDDLLWVSYYSSHEGKTSIYLARVKLAPPARVSVHP